MVRRLAGMGWAWPLVAGAIALSDGRRARRGALRGLLGVAAVSVVTRRPPAAPAGPVGAGSAGSTMAGVVHALRSGLAAAASGLTVGGRRGDGRLLSALGGSAAVGGAGRLSRPIASAFALAVGVAQEDRGRGAALLPAATALAAARVRARLDRPQAAVAGAAVGTLAAFATRRIWQVAPGTPAAAPRVWSVRPNQPEPEGDGLLLAVNPSSGPAWSSDPSEELAAGLPRAEVHLLTVGDDLGELVAARSARALGVAGGDGTVNAGVEAAMAADIPLLVVPAGTLNHFARDLGVETAADAVEAVRAGEVVAVDVGLIDGRPFVNTASFGSYAALVDVREQLEDRVGKWPAVLVALIWVLWRGRPSEVEIDGQRAKVWMIFIGNCSYQPEDLAPSWRERLDDGLLDVRMVDGTSPFSRTRLVAAVLTGRLGRTPIYRRQVVRSLHIRSTSGPLRLARDGETFDGGDEVLVTKAPTQLRVFRPATPSEPAAGPAPKTRPGLIPGRRRSARSKPKAAERVTPP